MADVITIYEEEFVKLKKAKDGNFWEQVTPKTADRAGHYDRQCSINHLNQSPQSIASINRLKSSPIDP